MFRAISSKRKEEVFERKEEVFERKEEVFEANDLK